MSKEAKTPEELGVRLGAAPVVEPDEQTPATVSAESEAPKKKPAKRRTKKKAKKEVADTTKVASPAEPAPVPNLAEPDVKLPKVSKSVMRPKSRLAKRYVPAELNCMYCQAPLSGENNAHDRPTKEFKAIKEIYTYCPVCQLEGHLAFVTPNMSRLWIDVDKALKNLSKADGEGKAALQRRVDLVQHRHAKVFRADNKRLNKKLKVEGPREAFLVNALFQNYQEKARNEQPSTA